MLDWYRYLFHQLARNTYLTLKYIRLVHYLNNFSLFSGKSQHINMLDWHRYLLHQLPRNTYLTLKYIRLVHYLNNFTLFSRKVSTPEYARLVPILVTPVAKNQLPHIEIYCCSSMEVSLTCKAPRKCRLLKSSAEVICCE